MPSLHKRIFYVQMAFKMEVCVTLAPGQHTPTLSYIWKQFIQLQRPNYDGNFHAWHFKLKTSADIFINWHSGCESSSLCYLKETSCTLWLGISILKDLQKCLLALSCFSEVHSRVGRTFNALWTNVGSGGSGLIWDAEALSVHIRRSFMVELCNSA